MDRRYIAYLLALERVDNRALSCVWIADKADTDLLLVRVQDTKLAQQLDQAALTEAVVDRSVKCKRRKLARKDLNPTCL